MARVGRAWYGRIMRSSLIDVLAQDFVRTARAKGLGRARVLFRHARKAWEEGKIDLVELGTEMGRHRRELFDLVGSVGADTRIIDLELAGESIEELPQSRKRNDVAVDVPVGEDA